MRGGRKSFNSILGNAHQYFPGAPKFWDSSFQSGFGKKYEPIHPPQKKISPKAGRNWRSFPPLLLLPTTPTTPTTPRSPSLSHCVPCFRSQFQVRDLISRLGKLGSSSATFRPPSRLQMRGASPHHLRDGTRRRFS